MGVTVRGTSSNTAPVVVAADRFSSQPEACAGDLVSVAGLRLLSYISDDNGDAFVRMAAGDDSITIYLDRDTGLAADFGTKTCYDLTGIVVRMRAPAGIGGGAAWCIAPRQASDIVATECFSGREPSTWGEVKTLFRRPSTDHLGDQRW